MTPVHADINALRDFREALARFRLAQQEAVARADDAIALTRGALEARAIRRQALLEQAQADLDACRAAAAQYSSAPGGGSPDDGAVEGNAVHGGGTRGDSYGGGSHGGGSYSGGTAPQEVPDCSAYVAAVAEHAELLDRVRRWQQRVEQQAAEFQIASGRFQSTLDTDLPRTEDGLARLIASLEAARRVQPAGS
jgi:hypothetical protein